MVDRSYSLNGSTKPPQRRFADLSGPDFYPTPDWVTYALLEKEEFKGRIWECACGDGAMSEVMHKFGYGVDSSDLHDRGYGETPVDFLRTKRRALNIVTNPPFHSAMGFVQAGLDLCQKKLCLLLRLAFLESGIRYRSIFQSYPPSRVWVFSERVTFYPKGVKRKGSGTTAYAWFVWEKEDRFTMMKLRPVQTELGWVEPGIKGRYKKFLLGRS